MARILNSPSRRSDLALAALLGLVAGLASSIKISGLPLFGLAYVLLLAIRELQDRRGLRRLVENCALFGLVGVSCIYALNPFYWPEVSKIHPSAAAREARALLFEGKRVELGAPFLVYAGARYDRRRLQCPRVRVLAEERHVLIVKVQVGDTVGAVDIAGKAWIEIDFPEDVDRATRDILPRI